MIDHTSCDHDRTPRDRAQCRNNRADLVDRLTLLAPSERNLVEVILDMADADTADAPARDLLGEARARSVQIITGTDAERALCRPDSIATVGDLLDHLATYRRDRPVMVIAGDAAGWLERVRDDHTGAIGLLAFGAE